MSKNRGYTREMTSHRWQILKKQYKTHITKKGFLSPNQKKRILKIKKMERGTVDADFWYQIRNSAKNAIMDLQLISEVSSDDILKNIFRTLGNEDYRKMDKGIYDRSALDLVISRILQSEKRPIDASQWKYDFATSVVAAVIYYLREIPKFSTTLHSRLFNDVLDTLLHDHNYDTRDFSSLSR